MQRFDVPPETVFVETQVRPSLDGNKRPGQLSADGLRFIGAATKVIDELQVSVTILSAAVADLEARVDALENP